MLLTAPVLWQPVPVLRNIWIPKKLVLYYQNRFVVWYLYIPMHVNVKTQFSDKATKVTLSTHSILSYAIAANYTKWRCKCFFQIDVTKHEETYQIKNFLSKLQTLANTLFISENEVPPKPQAFQSFIPNLNFPRRHPLNPIAQFTFR